MNRPDTRPDTSLGLSDEHLVQALLNAYRAGVFPMGDSTSDDVKFYRADPRGLLPLSEKPASGPAFHVPRTVEKLIRQGRFEFRTDTAFADVVRGCALPRPECEEDRQGTTLPGTWINRTIIAWYELLHARGHAHSVEAWVTAYDRHGQRESRLVGGIYGVALGAAFFGESMFHIPQPRLPDGTRDPFDGTGAGQACLVTLVRRLAARGFDLFDTQMVTSVTKRFGAYEVSIDDYEDQLVTALEKTPAPEF